METTTRTARISTTVGIKRNIGKYESLEFRKCIEVEVAYGAPSELFEKSKSLDAAARKMLSEEIAGVSPETLAQWRQALPRNGGPESGAAN